MLRSLTPGSAAFGPVAAVALLAWLVHGAAADILPLEPSVGIGGDSLVFETPPVTASDKAIERATNLVISARRLPLRTNGRYIVDRLGGRVKWSCVNWHGAQQRSWVTGGLHMQPAKVIAERIASLGFNCVRLSYSTEAVVKNPIVPADRVAANPQLIGKTFIEAFDAVVEALTQEHIMIIINNHMNTAGWCCTVDQDEGFWYTAAFNESAWLGALLTMANRYSQNKWVVAYDLRNEPHYFNGLQLTWGGGDPKTDYKMAMEKAGNAVLLKDPDALIVIEGLCFGMELRPVKHAPILLSQPNRVIYEVHNYQEFQFATLFTSHFYAWSYVREITGAIAFALVMMFFGVLFSCHRLRWPWAPRGVFLVTMGSWLAGVSLPCLVGAIITFVYYLKYCNLIAEMDVKPYIHFTFFTLTVGILLMLGGFLRFGLFGARYARICDPDARDFDDVFGGDDEKTDVDFDQANESGSDASKENLEPTESSEPELACLKAFSRAKVQAGGGPCCFYGFTSCRLLRSRTVGDDWKRKNVKLRRADWDCGVCLLWQMFCGLPSLLVILATLWFYALQAPLYGQLERELDRKWGFVLHDGYEYTAPVWMGEFGAGQKGTYWVNFVRYLSERDLDFAYWPLNADKLAAGYFDDWGTWNAYPGGEQWDEDTYAILASDYVTVRAPWRVVDLQPLMESPAGAEMNTQPCQREVIGRSCGG